MRFIDARSSAVGIGVAVLVAAVSAEVQAAEAGARSPDAGTETTSADTKARVHTVKLQGMKFIPSTLEVAVGDTVVWQNDDFVPHTTTATKGGAKPLFDSGNLPPKASFRYQATAPGKVPYICMLHPMMTGTIIVR